MGFPYFTKTVFFVLIYDLFVQGRAYFNMEWYTKYAV